MNRLKNTKQYIAANPIHTFIIRISCHPDKGGSNIRATRQISPNTYGNVNTQPSNVKRMTYFAG
jgi:hypothetical protein